MKKITIINFNSTYFYFNLIKDISAFLLKLVLRFQMVVENCQSSDICFTIYTYYVHKDWQINWDSTLLIVPMGSVPEYSQWIELMEGTKHYDSYKELRSPMEMFQQKEKWT